MPEHYSPDRSLTLTDGVVAIALTLLALDLKPDLDRHATSRQLWDYLGDHHSQYIAFVIAFWVVSRYWLLHHRMLRAASNLDDATVRANLLFLFAVTLVPLTTYLNGDYGNSLGVMLFALNLMFVGVSTLIVSELVHRRGLVDETEDEQARGQRHWRQGVALVVAALVAVMAWVIGEYANFLYLLLTLGSPPSWLPVLRNRI